jgi:hypothetical protein
MLASGDTTEENGTEINIPATKDQVKQFRKGAFRATYFWEVQPNFNDDDVPKLPQGFALSDKIKMYGKNDLDDDILGMDYYSSKLILLIDGIPYPVENNLINQCDALKKTLNRFTSNVRATYSIGNGELKVLQTREALEECKFTIDKLNEIGLDIEKNIVKYTSTMLKPTLQGTYEAYKKGSDNFSMLPVLKFDKNFNISTNGIIFDTGTVGKNKITGRIENVNYKFSAVEYHHRSQRWRKTLANSKRENLTYLALKLDEIPTYYIDDLPDEGENKKARRCKHLIGAIKGDVTYIKSDDMPKLLYNKLVNDLGIRLLSTLPLPPKAVKGASKGARKLDKGRIDVHRLTSYKSWRTSSTTREIKTIDLNGILGDRNYLWCDYSKKCKEFSTTDWTSFFKEKGFTCAYIGKKHQKAIIDDDRFININDYMASFKPTDLEVENVIYNQISFDHVDRRLLRACKKSGNRFLKKLANGIIKPNKKVEFPKSLKRQIVSDNHKELLLRQSKLAKLKKTMKLRYPLIQSNLSEEMILDYIIKVDRNQRRL